MNNNHRLQLKGVRKAFNGVTVLDGVSIMVAQGSVHALLGENGAGKSTLMNILGGVLPMDQGGILIDGLAVDIASPRDAKSMRIAFIHQELNIANDLTVAENLFLGSELKTAGWLHRAEMNRRAAEVLQRLDADIEPVAMASTLDAAQKQLVEIARALLFDARLIIMDEPTTALTEPEVHRLFERMRLLRDQGVSLIYISHKLKEIIEVCDRYTVLRDGKVVADGAIADVDETRLSDAMVGAASAAPQAASSRRPGKPMLTVADLACGRALKGVSFAVRASEIVGITGLAGDGRAELVASLFGDRSDYRGQILIQEKYANPKTPHQALASGIALIPRNRKENGIVKDLSIRENFGLAILPKISRWSWINRRGERDMIGGFRQQLRIKCANVEQEITRLSGGNQQKVILAKWLATDSPILILDNPTQGVDVGAKREIYPIISALADKGLSVIVSSAEVPELQRLCDRVLVFCQGRIVAELAGEQINEQNVMLHATGAAA
jgi:ribose transport system ATP-binding protein